MVDLLDHVGNRDEAKDFKTNMLLMKLDVAMWNYFLSVYFIYKAHILFNKMQ